MTWRFFLMLALAGLAVAALVAALQASPGYMDADYYYAGGLQLVTGRGFTEPYLWNYLDAPAGLPHPSNAYWMPLTSLLVAAGASLFGPDSWTAARVGFLLVAAAIPVVTAALAWRLTNRRAPAIISGLLAVLPGFYLVFTPTTDTFGLYMLLGGLFFLVLTRKPTWLNPVLLGILAGLMHLTRADGLLWLMIAFFAVIYVYPLPQNGRYRAAFSSLAVTLGGYLLVMGPWFVRNTLVFHAVLAPGGSKMLWLTSYDQIFSYPASVLTFSHWLDSGVAAILRVRLWALGLNLANAFSVQWEVFLLPLIAFGLWRFRKDRRIQVAILAWLITLLAMTVAFPFAGARGGFFHSGTAVQVVWWVLAPVGLEVVIEWGIKVRKWDPHQAGLLFRSALVIMAGVLTAVVIYSRVLGGGGNPRWGSEGIAYSNITGYLNSRGMSGEAVVAVANPPGFYLASGNRAIALPDGDVDTLLSAARQYGAAFAVLEDSSTPAGLMPAYQHPEQQVGLTYLGSVDGAKIYAIQP